MCLGKKKKKKRKSILTKSRTGGLDGLLVVWFCLLATLIVLLIRWMLFAFVHSCLFDLHACCHSGSWGVEPIPPCTGNNPAKHTRHYRTKLHIHERLILLAAGVCFRNLKRNPTKMWGKAKCKVTDYYFFFYSLVGVYLFDAFQDINIVCSHGRKLA